MPRLEGQRSNTGLYIVLAIVVLLVVLALLDYFGVGGLNLIPNFGAA